MLAWGNSLLLALLLGLVITWSGLSNWGRFGKETGQDLATKGAKGVLAERDVKQGETEKYCSDGSGKISTPQGIDKKQAQKIHEGSKEVDGDAPLLQQSTSPRPWMSDPIFLYSSGGQGSQPP